MNHCLNLTCSRSSLLVSNHASSLNIPKLQLSLLDSEYKCPFLLPVFIRSSFTPSVHEILILSPQNQVSVAPVYSSSVRCFCYTNMHKIEDPLKKVDYCVVLYELKKWTKCSTCAYVGRLSVNHRFEEFMIIVIMKSSYWETVHQNSPREEGVKT